MRVKHIENGILYNVIGGYDGTLLIYEGRSRFLAIIIAKLSRARLQIWHYKNGGVIKIEKEPDAERRID